MYALAAHNRGVVMNKKLRELTEQVKTAQEKSINGLQENTIAISRLDSFSITGRKIDKLDYGLFIPVLFKNNIVTPYSDCNVIEWLGNY